jgi:hypothetical protein
MAHPDQHSMRHRRIGMADLWGLPHFASTVPPPKSTVI